MKKIITAAIISLTVNLILMFINYRSYLETNYLKFAHRIHGGEITVEFGFGWEAVHIYAMSTEETSSHALRFNLLSLLIALLLGAGLMWLLLSVIGKVRKH